MRDAIQNRRIEIVKLWEFESSIEPRCFKQKSSCITGPVEAALQRPKEKGRLTRMQIGKDRGVRFRNGKWLSEALCRPDYTESIAHYTRGRLNR